MRKRIKQALSLAVVGAVALSIPMTTDAKRKHDPDVETKVESRQLSENNETINLTSNHLQSDKAVLKDRIDAILNSRQREQELLEQSENIWQNENVEVMPTLSLTDSSIIGTPMATQKQCVKYLLQNNPNPNIAVSAEEIVSYYYEEGKREGIRPDVAFA